MNLVAKTFLAACCLLSLSVSAELIHSDGAWRLKPGTASDTSPASRTEEVVQRINQAETLEILREDRGALVLWNQLIDQEAGTDAEAVALLGRARLFAKRGQFDNAEADLDTLYKGHANFSGFGQAVQLAFDLAGKYERGERRYLGGWFPWFKDPLHALTIYDKILKVAPHGALAEESLIHAARLAEREDRKEIYNEMLERIVSDYATSKYAPEALERLAKLRGSESLGADFDQASTQEAADHWRTLADQFPQDPRAKQAAEEIKALRDRAARARLNLGKFYWYKRNNPEAAKLMANACRSLSPESAAAKDAETLLTEIQVSQNPPKTIADRLLGTYPRPRATADAKPTVVGDELDALGFRKEAPKSATETERR
jgi:outer membrane protein assembly factor BamD